jgi:hypothetical protein
MTLEDKQQIITNTLLEYRKQYETRSIDVVEERIREVYYGAVNSVIHARNQEDRAINDSKSGTEAILRYAVTQERYQNSVVLPIFDNILQLNKDIVTEYGFNVVGFNRILLFVLFVLTEEEIHKIEYKDLKKLVFNSINRMFIGKFHSVIPRFVSAFEQSNSRRVNVYQICLLAEYYTKK